MTIRRKLYVLVALAIVIATAILAMREVRDPAEQARRQLAVTREIHVGHTTINELMLLIKSHGLPNMPNQCATGDCMFTLGTDNRLLARSHLAPPTYFAVTIRVRNSVVDWVHLRSWIGNFGNIADITIDCAPDQMACSGEDACVSRQYQTDHTPMRAEIHIPEGAMDAVRGKIYSLNPECLSKFGGCRNASELLPSIW